MSLFESLSVRWVALRSALARLVRRPLRDWPSWADDLNPIHTHGVPSHE